MGIPPWPIGWVNVCIGLRKIRKRPDFDLSIYFSRSYVTIEHWYFRRWNFILRQREYIVYLWDGAEVWEFTRGR